MAYRGVHPPETMMHFPPVSDFPLFSKNFGFWGKFSKFYLSLKNFLIFIREISDDLFFFLFFSHRPQISNFTPIFAVSVHFPPFRENYYFPLLWQIFPLFYTNSPAFYLLYVYFVSSYFYHDAFMHHPMHVLDAPGRHPVFFSCKEGGIFFTRISSLHGIKSGNFSAIYISNN